LDTTTITYINRAYAFVSKKEQYGKNFIAGTPQWISWIMDNQFPSRMRGELSQSNLIGAAAIAPTNLTPSRAKYVMYEAPNIIKLRFLLTFKALLMSGEGAVIALQKAVIASVRGNMLSERDYRKYWVNFSADPGSAVQPISAYVRDKAGAMHHVVVN
jgi:hypothetical protein